MGSYTQKNFKFLGRTVLKKNAMLKSVHVDDDLEKIEITICIRGPKIRFKHQHNRLPLGVLLKKVRYS